MILEGSKKEEYRALTKHWGDRLTKLHNFKYIDGMESLMKRAEYFFKDYDYIHFYNGWAHSLRYPNFLIECKGITIGEAVPEWSDNLHGKTFIIKLGEIVN